jgi:S1-C subfamily serine protease
LAARLGLDADAQGVVVTAVEPGSLADRAGVRVQDVIVSVGGDRITDLRSYRDAMAKQDLSRGVRMQAETEGLKRFILLRKR